MKYSHHVHRVVLCALFAALTCLATLVIQVPSPLTGYINLGDCLVLFSAFLLGPLYGSVAAGVGSALADMLSGYAQYAAGTLIIKALVAFVAVLLLRVLSRVMPSFFCRLLASVLAECIMIFGYFAYDAWIIGYGWGAAASIPANCVQAGIGVAVALLLVSLFRKNTYIANLMVDIQ